MHAQAASHGGGTERDRKESGLDSAAGAAPKTPARPPRNIKTYHQRRCTVRTYAGCAE